MVVWVGTVGAVIGPPSAAWANRIGIGFGIHEWVTPALLGVVGFAAAGLIINTWLRPDPLEVAGGIDPEAPRYNPIHGVTRTLRIVWQAG